MRQILLLGLLLFGAGHSLFATHVLGGELWYEHDTLCQYTIYTDVYHDCGGSLWQQHVPISTSGNPTTLAPLVSGVGGCFNVSPSSVAVLFHVDVTPLCPVLKAVPPGVNYPTICDNIGGTPILNGIALVRTRSRYNLCNLACTEFEVSWRTCCRSGAITNLSSPVVK